MEVEKGVIIIAYKKSNGSKRYAVLKRTKNWEGWETPKGHLEEDDYIKTVKIELNEELGVQKEEIKEITDLEEEVTWKYQQDGKEFKKIYKAFAAELKPKTIIDTSVNPCDEHETGFFLNYEDAKSLLKFDNNKDLLEKFHKNL